MKGRRVLISGSGNVAQFAAEKVIQLGGKPLSLSDSNGFIVDEEGLNAEKLAFVMQLKNVKRGRIKANHLVKNGCYCVCEGANMPTTPAGVNVFLESKILYGPGKAANAGGCPPAGWR
jgi:glutamate dehydrogenase/leucine dehydrogenase